MLIVIGMTMCLRICMVMGLDIDLSMGFSLSIRFGYVFGDMLDMDLV